MSCAQCRGLERLFDESTAARDLRDYRRKGPNKTTRWLIDALKEEGIDGATVMDIGGGIGAIQHELLQAGASRAAGVDASTAYLAAIKEEAERQGHADRESQRQVYIIVNLKS